MRIKQLANCQLAIRRFDTGDNIVFDQNTEIEVDEATGNYLKSMVAYDENYVLATNFVEVEA